MEYFFGKNSSIYTHGWRYIIDDTNPDKISIYTHGWYTSLDNIEIDGSVPGRASIYSSTNIDFSDLLLSVGEALVTGIVDIDDYITISTTPAEGIGYIFSDSLIGYQVPTENISGVGYIYSDRDIIDDTVYVIDGLSKGIGLNSMKVNSFRTKSIKPRLITQNKGYDQGDCPIAVVQNKGFSPNKIINIESKENDLFENTQYYNRVKELTSDTNFRIDYYPYSDVSSGEIDYLVTNKKADDLNGNPLFLTYELMYDTTSSADDIEIYRNGEVKIPKESYSLQFNYDLLNDLNKERYDSSLNWAKQQLSQNIHRCRLLLPLEFLDDNTYFTVKYTKYFKAATNSQIELIEPNPIYSTDDFYINSSGLNLTDGSRLEDSSSILITKDPRRRIKPMNIMVTRNNDSVAEWQSDQNSSWKLRVNTGQALTSSGIFSGDAIKYYKSSNRGYDGSYPVVKSKPLSINNDIIKLSDAPLFLDEDKYKYPDYQTDGYDETIDSLVEVSGKFAVNINGIARTDINIKSVDRNKGYIQLDTNLDAADDIELLYYTDFSKYFVLDNLELNPKLTDDADDIDFHISGYPNGFGLAYKPIISGEMESYYPYIYDLSKPESSRTMDLLYPKNPSDPGAISGVSYNFNDHDFFTFAEVGLNKLSTEFIDISDSRKIGGGLRKDKNVSSWLDNHNKSRHEQEWYSDNSFWDGEPVPHGSTIILHIPQVYIDNLVNRWLNSQSYEGDPYYKNEWARKEAYYYLDKIIKKYISAGTQYILYNENFELIDLGY